MATLRDLQSKARKALTKWKKDYAKTLEKDNRSPCSHLCMTILMRNNNITNARQAEQALRERFVDWNELRVSPIAEVRDVLESTKTPSPEQKAYALRRFLRDLFSKYTKTSLYFDLMDVPEVVPEGEEPAPSNSDDDEDDEELVTRETGLPDHPEVPGFVDMRVILDQPMPLDPKLVEEKNSSGTAGIVWDDAERAPFATMWRVCVTENIIEPELEGFELVQRLRQVTSPNTKMDEWATFAFYAIVHAQNNWPKIVKESDKIRKKVAKEKAKSA